MCNPCRKSDHHAEGYAVGEEDSRESVGGMSRWKWELGGSSGGARRQGEIECWRGWGDSGGRRWWWPEAGEDRVERAEGKC